VPGRGCDGDSNRGVWRRYDDTRHARSRRGSLLERGITMTKTRTRKKPMSGPESTLLCRRMPTDLMNRVHTIADHEGRHLNRIVRDLLEGWVAEKEGSREARAS
jgi:hypothetical protein